MTVIQYKIVSKAVENLRNFGYSNVNEENIFTDMIYSAFFKRMLEEELGKGYDHEINPLIKKK